MTIQLSVTIWTIICFCLLMVILHHLLFKPVLQLMDRRKEKVAAAAAKKEEYERLAAEHEAKLMEQRQAAHEKRQKQMKDALEKIRIESKLAIDGAKKERIRELDYSHAKADAERKEILQVLSAHGPALARSFAECLTKD